MEYMRFAETGKYFGIESQILSPKEVKEVHPLMHIDDVYGGVYSPGDGSIDPTSCCVAYAKAARKLGGQIFEKTGCTDIETESYTTIGGQPQKRIVAVHTTCGGRIKTGIVV